MRAEMYMNKYIMCYNHCYHIAQKRSKNQDYQLSYIISLLNKTVS